MENVIVSKNRDDIGNPYHKGSGTPEGGQFTDAGGMAGGGKSDIRVKQRVHEYFETAEQIRCMAYIDVQNKKITDEQFNDIVAQVNDKLYGMDVPLIMEDINCSEEDAIRYKNSLRNYFSEDYHEFSNGNRPDDVREIEEFFARSPKYDGTIFRGLSFNVGNKESVAKLNMIIRQLAAYKENPNIPFTVSFKDLSPTSWSSDESVVDKTFGRLDNFNFHSVKFIVRNNKSGVGVQHLSEYGTDEAEVLMPKDKRFRIVGLKTSRKPIYNARQYIIELEEI